MVSCWYINHAGGPSRTQHRSDSDFTSAAHGGQMKLNRVQRSLLGGMR